MKPKWKDRVRVSRETLSKLQTIKSLTNAASLDQVLNDLMVERQN